VVTVERQLCDCDEFLSEIKERLLQLQQLIKKEHDKKHRDIAFAVGDWVWLRLSHRPAASVRPIGASKLGAKYFGPYQILEKIGFVSYRLQLLPDAKIHNVLHAVFLKKFGGQPPMVTPPLPLVVHGHVVPTLECVVCARSTAMPWELLVQWQGRTTAEATWEEMQQFKEVHPDFELGDELFRHGGGSVIDSFFHR
jgi:hypothetical protein